MNTELWECVAERLESVLGRAELLLEAHLPETAYDPALFVDWIAFRWERRGRGGRLIPVRYPHLVDLDDLVGIDFSRDDLVRNTEQFVSGLPANNVLLWGERGTGKSSCVKGLLKPFAPRGLRLIEVERTDLATLPDLLDLLRRDSRRFIIFCDDLSFAEGDASYQELKTLLDGGLEERPANTLIYATSNRRHLMPEQVVDTLKSEIHPEEAVSDRLSLADRFGLHLSFYSFDQVTYLTIVEQYADRAGLDLERTTLHREALRWATQRGQRSGRAARQFIDDLCGRMGVCKGTG
jgi:predicted AAA+ superfamily ATPase